MSNFDNFIEVFEELRESEYSFVVATVVQINGSYPQNIGARAIFNSHQLLHGTVGGGRIENCCLEHAGELITQKQYEPHLKTWNLQKDLGMTCGGVVSIFFEVFCRQKLPNIVVFGAGHVSQELCRLLIKLDIRLTCLDSRAEWLELLPKESPFFKKSVTDDLVAFTRDVAPQSYCILMTQGSTTDYPILRALVEREDLAYLGVIGSLSKRRALEKQLSEDGINSSFFRQFNCPIGENIGSNSPYEIALSIVFQLMKIF